jgi:hypothetical protein
MVGGRTKFNEIEEKIDHITLEKFYIFLMEITI